MYHDIYSRQFFLTYDELAAESAALPCDTILDQHVCDLKSNKCARAAGPPHRCRPAAAARPTPPSPASKQRRRCLEDPWWSRMRSRRRARPLPPTRVRLTGGVPLPRLFRRLAFPTAAATAAATTTTTTSSLFPSPTPRGGRYQFGAESRYCYRSYNATSVQAQEAARATAKRKGHNAVKRFREAPRPARSPPARIVPPWPVRGGR